SLQTGDPATQWGKPACRSRCADICALGRTPDGSCAPPRENRKQHGSKGSHVFRDPNESDRVWAIFDWDQAGWQSFISDPEVPAIFQEAGFTQGPPKSAEFLRQHDA